MNIISKLELKSCDESLQLTIQNSKIIGLFQKVAAAGARLFSFAAPIHGIFEKLSFALVMLLSAILAAPQFVNDKEGIALIIVAAFVLRIVSNLTGKDETTVGKINTIDLLVLAFLAINIISTCSSHYLLPSIKGLSKLVVYVISYFLFLNCLSKKSSKRISELLFFLTAGGTLVALYGLYQYKIGVAPLATWEDPNIEDKATRIYSTLNNPNLLAGYLLPLIPVSLALTVQTFFQKNWLKVLCPIFLITTAIIGAATVLTGSRGAYIGLAASFAALGGVCLSLFYIRKPKLRIFVIGVILLLPVLAWLALHFSPSFEHRVMSIFAGREHSSNSYRLNVWHSSWNMFLDNWWFGIGPGNQTFRLCYGLYMVSGFDALGTYSVPLEIAVECGIFGLAIFACLLLALFARAHSAFWQKHNFAQSFTVLCLTAAIVGIMAHGLVDTVFYRPQVQVIFWMLVASLRVLTSLNQSEN